MAGVALRLKIFTCLLRSTEAANIPPLAVQVTHRHRDRHRDRQRERQTEGVVLTV